MVAKLIFTPEAREDLDEAYGWYERQRMGLGEDFLSRVDACVQAIRRNPEMHSAVHLQYRRALVRRFPYAVFYEYLGDSVIIYGVFHSSRDSAKWRDRLP
jgi:plasmid stabilization system protein ParE